MVNTRIARLASLLLSGVLASAAHTATPVGKAYVGNFADNTVSVIDLARLEVTSTIPVAAGPHGMVASGDGSKVYIGGDGSSMVQVIDTATDVIARSIEVGAAPHGLAAVPGTTLVMACVYGRDEIAFIDTTSDTVIARVPVSKPHTIAVRPDGKLAYVASQKPGDFALVAIDIASRTVARTLPLTKPPRDLEFAFDGHAMYFTQAGVDAVQVFDPVAEKVVAEIATGASPHIASVFRGAPTGIAVVQGPGELLLFDAANNKPLRSIAVGKQPHWMAAARAGTLILVTNEGSDSVSAVDAGNVIKTVAVGKAPRKIVVVGGAVVGGAVTIDHFAFAPADLEVDAGVPVTWINDDGSPHGIAFSDGAAGETLMLPGASFARIFLAPGVYEYVCPIHPFMLGRVHVNPS